jgi:L-threonine kinase
MVESGREAPGPTAPQFSLDPEAGDFCCAAPPSTQAPAVAVIRVALPGTCGELVQGTLEGLPALVSCPIDLFATAEIRVAPAGPEGSCPAPKAEAALRLARAAWGAADADFALRLSTNLPRSRGYGSSTADVGAALYGLAALLGRTVTPEEVARLAVQVEPTDSTVCPGLALLDHRSATRCQTLGPAPPLAVVVVDPGGEVDTLAFNRRDLAAALRRLAPRHHEAFALLETGLAHGDLPALGAAATLSAVAHNEILHHPLLERTLSLAREAHALGLCCAHSGTLLGVLLDPSQDDVAEVTRFLRLHLGAVATVTAHRLVGGGPRWPGPHEADAPKDGTR